MHLFNISKSKPDSRSSSKSKLPDSPLIKALKDGFGISESQYVFALSAKHNVMLQKDRGQALAKSTGMPDEAFLQHVWTVVPSQVDSVDDGEQNKGRFRVMGDVVLVRATCLDQALWKIGGPTVALRLVQAATVSRSFITTAQESIDAFARRPMNSQGHLVCFLKE